DWHLQGVPDPGGHPPAHQLLALSHRARLAPALTPAKRRGALPVAIAQVLAAERPAGVLVAVGITPQAELERIKLERHCQFVHGALQRINAGGRAWTTH